MPLRTISGARTVSGSRTRSASRIVSVNRRLTTPINAGVPRGWSSSGMEFASSVLPGVEGTNYTTNSQSTFTYFGNKGLTLVRVPFLWERLQPTKSGSLDPTYAGYMDTIVTYAANAGCKVMFEPHNFGGRQVSGNAQKVGDGTLTIADFQSLWTLIAERYLNNSNVWGYDLMNEPTGMPVFTTPSNYNTTSSVTLMNQAGINAIRAVDTSKYIVAEGENYAGLQNFTSYYGSNPTPWYSDPQNKTYYSWHYYFDGDHSGSYSGANTSLTGSGLAVTAAASYLQTVAQWAISNGVLIGGNPAIFMGEYGVANDTTAIGGSYKGTDEGYLSALNSFMNMMDQYKIAGTHWAAGDWYSSPTSLQPNGSVDRAQMAIIGNHLGKLN